MGDGGFDELVAGYTDDEIERSVRDRARRINALRRSGADYEVLQSMTEANGLLEAELRIRRLARRLE